MWRKGYSKNICVTFAFTCLLVVAARIYRCTACSLCWPGPQIHRPLGPRQNTARASPSTQGLKAACRPAEKKSEKKIKCLCISSVMQHYIVEHATNCSSAPSRNLKFFTSLGPYKLKRWLKESMGCAKTFAMKCWDAHAVLFALALLVAPSVKGRVKPRK